MQLGKDIIPQVAAEADRLNGKDGRAKEQGV